MSPPLPPQGTEVVVQGAPVPPVPPVPDLPPLPPIDVQTFPEGVPADVVHMMSGPPEWVGIVAVLVMAIIGATIVLFPLARAWARRLDRGSAAPQLGSADVSARLERIENAVESMAVEVERISEGQRFLTRVMADFRQLPGSDAAPAERARIGAEVLPPSERRR